MNESQPTIEAQLQEFIQVEVAYDEPTTSLQLDEPLLEGILDSTAVLRLVLFLEETFHVQIADSEIIPANFATLRSVARLVRGKTKLT